MKKNSAAVALGKLAKGIPKTLTAAERARRARRAKTLVQSRWDKNKEKKLS